MSQVIILYPDRVPPFGLAKTARLGFDSIELVAGINNLSPEQIETLQSHPDFARFKQLKAIELIESSEEVEPSTNSSIPDLSAYAVEDAQKLIMETVDLATLENWQNSETRKTVKSTLSTRISQLKSGVM